MSPTITPPAPSPLSEFSLHPSAFPLFLPAGHLTLILGNPGIGKSLLAIDLAARLSQGQLPPSPNPSPHPVTPSPCHPLTPSSTILLSLEDTRNTLNTRLQAAHADPTYIQLPDNELSLIPDYAPESLSGLDPGILPAPLISWLFLHLPKIPNPRLLILDPLPAFLGHHDCYTPSAVRSLLNPLLVVAEHFNIAVLGITHLNKSTKSKNPLHRAIGSLAYTALARTIYLVDYHTSFRIDGRRPRTLTQTPRIVIPLKSNLTPITHATAFDITPEGNLHWHPDPITDHPLLSIPEPSENPLEDSELDFACHFLTTTLANGPLPSQELLHQARAQGISHRTLERARSELNIERFHDGKTGTWLATLPKRMPMEHS